MGCKERDSAGGRWRMAGTKASGGRGVTGVSHGGKPVMGTRGRRRGDCGDTGGDRGRRKAPESSETKCKRTITDTVWTVRDGECTCSALTGGHGERDVSKALQDYGTEIDSPDRGARGKGREQSTTNP